MSCPDFVIDRLLFARKRLDELRILNNGDLLGAPPLERQQLMQEFFFHLVGAIDFLFQVVNDKKKLSIPKEDVGVLSVMAELKPSDQIRELLEELHPKTKGVPLLKDPYSEEGLHFRIILFRNHVSHWEHAPYFFRLSFLVGNEPSQTHRTAHLRIDPRDENPSGSEKPAIDELEEFWNLVNKKCTLVLNLLDQK